MVLSQASIFLIFTIEGAIIGLIFDIFRILRKSFKTSDILTYLEDILFWIITGILVLYSIFVFNNGEIRFFMFIAILLGTGFYMLLISKYIIKTSVTVILAIKKTVKFIYKIIIFPISFLIKTIKAVFKKPILFCIINIKKLIKQVKDNIQKINIKAYKKTTKKAKKVKNKGEKKNKSRIIN